MEGLGICIFIYTFWNAVEARTNVPLPPLVELGHFRDDRVVTRVTRSRPRRELDPHAPFGSRQYIDFITYRYLKPALEETGIDPSIVDKLMETRTRSNFVDERTASLDAAIASEATPWFQPPEGISSELYSAVMYIYNYRYMGMDQYLLIPFLVG